MSDHWTRDYTPRRHRRRIDWPMLLAVAIVMAAVIGLLTLAATAIDDKPTSHCTVLLYSDGTWRPLEANANRAMIGSRCSEVQGRFAG